MKKLTLPLLIGLLMVPLLASGRVLAAKTPANIGNDISYPQCNKSLPSGQAFGIVGVNGGLATTTNPCLAKQLVWAQKSSGSTNQPKVQLYVNTANPGGLNTPSWPRSNIDSSGNLTLNPYGACDGSDSMACAWQYGWNRTDENVKQRFPQAAQQAGLPTDPKLYPWWLDVETLNTWKSGSAEALASNAAVLEGMTAYFQSINTPIGIYSTAYQWNQIAAPSQGSNLNGLPNWRAGARSLKGAQTNCSLAPLTPGGNVVLTQYVTNNLDYDHSCGG